MDSLPDNFSEMSSSQEEYLPEFVFVYINNNQYKIDTKFFNELGAGGTSYVYRCTIGVIEGKVVKIYKKSFIERHQDEYLHKINEMLSSVPDNACIILDEKKYYQFVWPEGLVLDENKKFIGFYMPYVDATETYNFIEYIKNVEDFPEEHHSITHRIQVACNLAGAVHSLHKAGHYFIDMKPDNMAIYRKTSTFLFLDCDGFSIRKGAFPAQHFTPSYISPDTLINKHTPEQISHTPYQDYYVLAVLIFQLLDYGNTPFSCILQDQSLIGLDDDHSEDTKVKKQMYAYALTPNPLYKPIKTSIYNYWPKSIRKMFDNAFTTNPSERPTAKQWFDTLHNIVEEESFRKCRIKPKSPSHEHFKETSCFGCEVFEAGDLVVQSQPINAIPEAIEQSTQGDDYVSNREQKSTASVKIKDGAEASKVSSTTKSKIYIYVSLSLVVLLIVSFFVYQESTRNVKAADLSAFESFSYEARLPINPIKKAIIRIGNAEIDINIVSVDSNKNWQLINRFRQDINPDSNTNINFREILDKIFNLGVSSKQDITYLVDMDATKSTSVNSLMKDIKFNAYNINVVTESQLSEFFFLAAVPNQYYNNSHMVFLSGERFNVVWKDNSGIIHTVFYSKKSLSQDELSQALGSIPAQNRENCFIVVDALSSNEFQPANHYKMLASAKDILDQRLVEEALDSAHAETKTRLIYTEVVSPMAGYTVSN